MTSRTFDPSDKGVPFDGDARGRSLFAEGASFPAAVLLRSALERNSANMSDYCRRNGVALAPHGKTTMSPELFELQLRDGAWAITAANVHQARAMCAAGVPRVLIANEVTSSGDIAWLAEQVGSGAQILCYVDSVAGVHLLREGLARHAPAARLDVLVELGVPGGRTGARTAEAALEVARAAAAAPGLRVVGVAGFEGIIVATEAAGAEVLVDQFLGEMTRVARAILGEGLATDTDEFVVSAGGSVFFDRVVRVLTGLETLRPIRVVLRSGCYLTHDDGVIDDLSPLGARPRVEGGLLHAALEVWAPVLSRPEPTRVIVGAGRRDLSTDGLYPVAKKWVRRGTQEVQPLEPRCRALRVDDQHAYFDVGRKSPLSVGDLVGLGISHPCTTFDKWRVIWVVDDAYDVVDVVTTRF